MKQISIWLIEYDTGYSQSIVVKFICAAEGYAPELIAIDDVKDWKMVVMEFIEGDTLQELGVICLSSDRKCNSTFTQP